MVDFEKYFSHYCKENGLEIAFSYDMPKGYDTANGTFDVVSQTLFFNKEFLKNAPDFEQTFYLFHELRHASQYLHPERFGDAIRKSCRYVIMYDGHCYKLVENEWKECTLDGDEDYFDALYLAQPHEIDANAYAYEKVKSIYGPSAALDELYSFWTPKMSVPESEYEKVYSEIDRKAR